MAKIKLSNLLRKDKTPIYSFTCAWCGYVFNQKIKTSGEDNSTQTDSVCCPRCKVFLKSDSGVKL